MLPQGHAASIDALHLETAITPFTLTDDKDTVDNLMAANGGPPVISQRGVHRGVRAWRQHRQDLGGDCPAGAGGYSRADLVKRKRQRENRWRLFYVQLEKRIIDTEKSRQELINQCRYYKGEEENPYKDYTEGLLWDYERSFVADSLSAGTPNNKSLFGVDEYIGCGLKDFQKDDCHPIELKARLFNRYAKGCYSMLDAVEPFKEFYLKYYQAGCADL